MNSILKQCSITISILILLVSYYDFLVLNEYKMEPVAVLGVSLLMIFNIVRHFSEKINSTNWLKTIIYILILSITIVALCFLLLMSFGIGYTGRKIPLNHIFAVFLTVSLIIITILEFHYVLYKK